MVPITPIRMVCRLTLLCKGVFQSSMLFGCSCQLLFWSCVITVFNQSLTSMRWTFQRERCIACMSLWWPFSVPIGSMQIAFGQEQDQTLSAERFGRSHWVKVLLATCAGKTRLCWAIRVSILIPVKMMFPPKSPLFKVLMMSLEAITWCYVFQSPCFELRHSDSQKAYGFGCLADDTTGKMN